MTYEQATEYLFTQAPLFQNIGAGAYKEGLENSLALDRHFGHPHTKFKTVHVAGTNGKGSTSHTLAAILQDAGYKVGLYTSPHLVDFRERIRVNGEPISREAVVSFVVDHKDFFEPLHPSFFELATAMAFNWFAQQGVDIAVIEVGLGGRLDCTNIITPILSVITNIGFDHMAFLGNTLAAIASEKAGIIKPGVPVVIGETSAETAPVFKAKARQENAPITFADADPVILGSVWKDGFLMHTTRDGHIYKGQLGGECQKLNANTILTAVYKLQQIGLDISTSSIGQGFENVCTMTGLMGRWQTVCTAPLTICDTAHNSHGFKHIVRHLQHIMQNPEFGTMRIVFGMVNDKDISTVLSMLPKNAVYYFTQASVKRALPVNELVAQAKQYNLNGNTYPNVESAAKAALEASAKNDMIYIGGSSFIVADYLSESKTEHNDNK